MDNGLAVHIKALGSVSLHKAVVMEKNELKTRTSSVLIHGRNCELIPAKKGQETPAHIDVFGLPKSLKFIHLMHSAANGPSYNSFT